MTSDAKSGLISGSIGFLSRAASQITLLAVTIAATRSMPIATFGAFAIASAILFLCRQFFYVGSYEYLLKATDETKVAGPSLIVNALFACLCLALMGLLSFASAPVFGTTLVGELLLWLAPSLLIVMWTAWFEAMMLRSQAVSRYYIYTTIGEVAGGLAAILAFANGFGAWGLVVQIYVRLTLLLFLYVRANNVGWPRHFDRDEVRRIIDWSWSRYSAVLLNFTSGYGADLVLGALLTPAATGIYRASSRVVSALSDLFAQPLQKIAQTNISALVGRGHEFDGRWLTMFIAIAAVAWSALATLALSAGDIVPLVLGAHWTSAVPVVIVFCAVRALSLLDAVTTSLLVCADRQRFMLRVQVTVAVLVVAVSALLAGKGPVAVAIGSGTVMCGLTTLYALEAARLTQQSRQLLLKAVLTASVPALCTLTLLLTLTNMPGFVDLPLIGRLTTIAAVSILATSIGLALIRGSLTGSIRSLSPATR